MLQIDQMPPPPEFFVAALEKCVDAAALDWLKEGLESIGVSDDKENQLAVRSASAERRLGSASLGEKPLTLSTACGTLDVGAWRRGDAGRICLMLAALANAEAGWQTLVRNFFRQGDEAERAAIVRALCLLREPCALLDVAQEAGRINSLHLYAALALDNPYPAACFDEHAFNQVVLKCLFNGLPIAHIVGLPRRANSELSRMCEDYIDERTAAGREVPYDIWLAVEPHASPRGLALILLALRDGERSHRYNAALALSRRPADPRVREAFASRLPLETDPSINDVLRSSIVGAPDGESA